MAKEKREEKVHYDNLNFDIDTSEEEEVLRKIPKKEVKNTNKVIEDEVHKVEPVINCLRNERIVVRHVPKLTGIWGNNPKHILSGGMAENAVRTFVVPRLASGMFVNVLTDSEKAFLEDIMGLEYNALSIYKRKDNFWDDSTEGNINRVRLTKGDNYFNLSEPEDYIRYKILLANKDYIAPSLAALQDTPKATYQFVIISQGEEVNTAKLTMSNTMACYKEFGKIENNLDVLKLVIETIDGRPMSPKTSLAFLQTKANDFIQHDSKLFLKIVRDPLLSTKVIINKSLEAGNIVRRGDFYYDLHGEPLCNANEEPTLNVAARFLNLPKNQEKKFSLEAKLK